MKKALGTILPTKKSLQINESWHAQNEREKLRIASAAGLGKGIMIEGERRYYQGANKYAIVSRNLRVLWFEVRADGDYALKS